MTYTPTTPQPTENLSVSQGLFLTNFQQLNSLYDLDHWKWDDLTAVNRGHHKIIKFPVVQPDPGIAAPTVSFYTKLDHTKNHLFAQNGPLATDTYQVTSDSIAWNLVVQNVGGVPFTFADPSQVFARWKKMGKGVYVWGRFTNRIGNCNGPGAGVQNVFIGGFTGLVNQPPVPTAAGEIYGETRFSAGGSASCSLNVIPGSTQMQVFFADDSGVETITVPATRAFRFIFFAGYYE